MLKSTKILRGLFFDKIPYLCLIFTSIFMACEQPKKGCTDIRATNFDVTAAESDKTACIFPQLVFQVSYTVGDSNYIETSSYKNTLGQSFKIVRAATYLSDFQLIQTDNTIAKPIDSIFLYRQTDTIKALNSFAMIGRNNGFEFPIGTFDAVGKSYAKCRFSIGLSSEVNKTDAAKMQSGHPLSTRPDSMYNRATKSYIFNKIVLASGINFKDTLQVDMTSLSPVELTKNILTTEGQNAVVKLKVNYLLMLKDVNFTEAKNISTQKIVDNATKVFSL
ncbi:MAG: MbnP family protein [Saprospiraceae bacterium]|nr:MbnP family protein [Saprospiraceae bacterium]